MKNNMDLNTEFTRQKLDKIKKKIEDMESIIQKLRQDHSSKPMLDDEPPLWVSDLKRDIINALRRHADQSDLSDKIDELVNNSATRVKLAQLDQKVSNL
eukprot:UN27009